MTRNTYNSNRTSSRFFIKKRTCTVLCIITAHTQYWWATNLQSRTNYSRRVHSARVANYSFVLVPNRVVRCKTGIGNLSNAKKFSTCPLLPSPYQIYLRVCIWGSNMGILQDVSASSGSSYTCLYSQHGITHFTTITLPTARTNNCTKLMFKGFVTRQPWLCPK
jgi:hypothetical protein